MTRSKWLASFGLAALVLSAVFFFPRPAVVQEVAAVEAAPAPLPVAAAPAAFTQAKPLERVVALYETESKRVGRVDKDPALTERRLSSAAAALNGEELAWLASQAMDLKNDMDSRFFATYLAALSRSEAGLSELKKIALSPVPELKQEMRRAEERALRMQAVEGFAHNCGLASVRGDLLDIIEGQTDEAVRDRAHRALYACQTGKTLQDGDKEALRKLKDGR